MYPCEMYNSEMFSITVLSEGCVLWVVFSYFNVGSFCGYNFYFPNDKMFSIFSCASSPFEHLLFSVNTISKKLRTK